MPLPWFRRKQQQSAATIATPFTELAPEELPLGEKEAPAPSDSTVAAGPESGDQAAKPKRRRGSRGGRNRRKPASGAAAEPAETPEQKQQAPAKAEKEKSFAPALVSQEAAEGSGGGAGDGSRRGGSTT